VNRQRPVFFHFNINATTTFIVNGLTQGRNQLIFSGGNGCNVLLYLAAKHNQTFLGGWQLPGCPLTSCGPGLTSLGFLPPFASRSLCNASRVFFCVAFPSRLKYFFGRLNAKVPGFLPACEPTFHSASQWTAAKLASHRSMSLLKAQEVSSSVSRQAGFDRVRSRDNCASRYMSK